MPAPDEPEMPPKRSPTLQKLYELAKMKAFLKRSLEMLGKPSAKLLAKVTDAEVLRARMEANDP